MENKRAEISDSEALGVFLDNQKKRPSLATKFVPYTVVHPVKVARNSGVVETEIQKYVRMGEYVSPRRWEIALEKEKKYKKLNEAWKAEQQKLGKKVLLREVANPLKASVLGA